jgi:hypothetical protein
VDPELEDVEPLVEPAPEELLVDPPVLLLVDPELELLLLPEPEPLLVDPELPPELPPEELDPPDEPDPDPPPVPNGDVEVVPPHAPMALRGSETARHTYRKRACIGVLLQEPMRPIANVVPSRHTGLCQVFFPPATQVSQPTGLLSNCDAAIATRLRATRREPGPLTETRA